MSDERESLTLKMATKFEVSMSKRNRSWRTCRTSRFQSRSYMCLSQRLKWVLLFGLPLIVELKKRAASSIPPKKNQKHKIELNGNCQLLALPHVRLYNSKIVQSESLFGVASKLTPQKMRKRFHPAEMGNAVSSGSRGRPVTQIPGIFPGWFSIADFNPRVTYRAS